MKTKCQEKQKVQNIVEFKELDTIESLKCEKLKLSLKEVLCV